MRVLSTTKRSSGVIQLVPLLIVAVFLLGSLIFVSSNKTGTNKVLSESGESGGGGSSGSGSSGSGSSDSGSKSGESSSGSSSGGSETRTGTSTKTETENKEAKKEVRVERRLPSGVRVKTETKEGKTKTEIFENGRKIKFEIENGNVRVKIENENEQEEELADLENEVENEGVEVEEGTQAGKIRVKAENKKFVVKGKEVEAETNFPVSVDLKTKQLTVTTPAGEKVVTVLPDAAVANMLAAHVVDRVLPTTGTQKVEIKTRPDGSLVYEIQGVTDEKLFGIIPVLISKTAEVSPTTGQVEGVTEPLVFRLLDLLSF